MIKIGSRIFPSVFIKSVLLEDKNIVICFYLGHKIKIKFKSKSAAEAEFRMVNEKLESSDNEYKLL